MAPYIIVLCILLIAVAVAFMIIKVVKIKHSNNLELGFSLNSKKNSLSVKPVDELAIRFEDFSELTEQEEAALVEVTDSKLLARIDNAVPGTLQAVANTGAVKTYQDAAKATGQLYQAIIPRGAVLDKSRAMEGAYRASYREVANSIKGNANLVAVDNKAANNLAAVGAANAVMNVASMVVGQYYMSQINEQLDGINAGIEKIVDFQQNEFKSKVCALVAEVQASSTFQVETMENDELRNRELIHMKSLEHECAQLLGQANLSLQEITEKKGLDFDTYEKKIVEAENWFKYQQILLELMSKISDLTYTLNLGAISRENSFALYLPYAKQSEGTLAKLNEWHDEHVNRLEISVEESRRKRQGVEGFFMGALGLFNDDFNYKKISKGTIARIEHQADSCSTFKIAEDEDLYQEDVRLIAREGKLFYLPNRISADA
ncbi:hypothetical protein [Butyrivibrio sp. AE3004]|uniref:hypothetical protein n=1 Tax=Butyrivibrio sp. AE3004 TaxID=1506994 RepID=UPI000494A44E|nr:hypothetical protein [Butyrivibrio sp. AE3004]